MTFSTSGLSKKWNRNGCVFFVASCRGRLRSAASYRGQNRHDDEIQDAEENRQASRAKAFLPAFFRGTAILVFLFPVLFFMAEKLDDGIENHKRQDDFFLRENPVGIRIDFARRKLRLLPDDRGFIVLSGRRGRLRLLKKERKEQGQRKENASSFHERVEKVRRHCFHQQVYVNRKPFLT